MKLENAGKRIPHPYVLVVFMVIIAALASYLLPAGEFNRIEDPNTGKMIVQAGTYHILEQSPVGFLDFLLSFQGGLVGAASIVFYVLMIGGSFGIIQKTGAIDALMAKTIVRFKGSAKESTLLIVLMLFFSLNAGIYGMYGESLVFAPFLVMLCITLGYDAVVGVALTMVAVSAGYAAAPINPGTVGLAQGIVGLPIMSGMGFRWVFFAFFMTGTIWYVLRYANKIKKDPSQSLVAGIDYSDMEISEDPTKTVLTPGHIRVLVVFFGALIFLIYGSIKYKYSLDQVATLFFFMGILSGLVYRMKLNDIADNFIAGAQVMVYPALIVGFARAITNVMQQGMIMDTVVYYLVKPLEILPSYLAAAFMVPVQSLVNLFVPSGSGQAMVTMPIMAPIADILEIKRQVAVLAYQMGDGITNVIIPTNGVLMAGIAIGKIPYSKWLSFSGKLVLLQFAISMIFVVIAVFIGLGPM